MANGHSANFSLLCWNIGNPSQERAANQAQWLRKRPEDILVLTETKHSQGCGFLERYFRAYGYNVIFPVPEGNEYGVMIVSKLPITMSTFSDSIRYLPSRVVSARVEISGEITEIIGAYVPSRDSSPAKTTKKMMFLQNLYEALESLSSSEKRVFCGDLNIVEPNHVPRYPFFDKFEYEFYERIIDLGWIDTFRHLEPHAREYSWFGRTQDGYRYDHCFVSSSLVQYVAECFYLHQPREDKLSDHSALVLVIADRSAS